MSDNLKRNRFIPFRKADVIDMCFNESKLPRDDIEAFKDLCQILEAIFHFEFHGRLEKLKACYAPFNPDADTRGVFNYSAAEKENLQKQLVAEMTAVLTAANFEKITAQDLKQALAEESIFQIRLEVDFEDFEDVIFFRSGESIKEEILVKYFGLWKKSFQFTNYDRVAIYIKFKEAVLAYYFLLTADEPLTKPMLDERIENWLSDRWDCRIDFEIGDAIRKLQRLKLIAAENDHLRSVPLDSAKQQLDTIWDNYFTYNQTNLS